MMQSSWDNSNELITSISVRSTQISTTLDGDWRLRRSGSNTNSTTNSPSRFQNNSKTNLNRRSLQHHQSNGSLHSADSQSSTSPAPSPLPRPATVNSTAPLQLNNNQQHALQSPSSATNLAMTQSGANSPTGLNKRWNSTGDFVTSPTNQQSSTTLQSARFATKSLLNLQSKNGTNSLLKHGWVWRRFYAEASHCGVHLTWNSHFPFYYLLEPNTHKHFKTLYTRHVHICYFVARFIVHTRHHILRFFSTSLRIILLLALPIDLLGLLFYSSRLEIDIMRKLRIRPARFRMTWSVIKVYGKGAAGVEGGGELW